MTRHQHGPARRLIPCKHLVVLLKHRKNARTPLGLATAQLVPAPVPKTGVPGIDVFTQFVPRITGQRKKLISAEA